MSNLKICTVNKHGELIYLKEGIQLPDNVPKVKHEARVFHPDYLKYLQKEIKIRVSLKKQLMAEKQEHQRQLKKLNEIIMKNCQRNIIKIFDYK